MTSFFTIMLFYEERFTALCEDAKACRNEMWYHKDQYHLCETLYDGLEVYDRDVENGLCPDLDVAEEAREWLQRLEWDLCDHDLYYHRLLKKGYRTE